LLHRHRSKRQSKEKGINEVPLRFGENRSYLDVKPRSIEARTPGRLCITPRGSRKQLKPEERANEAAVNVIRDTIVSKDEGHQQAKSENTQKQRDNYSIIRLKRNTRKAEHWFLHYQEYTVKT
jgi:hypothetical protein